MPAKKKAAKKKLPANRYTVVGNHTVGGVAKGGTLTVDDPKRARQLVRAGHIRKV